MATDADSCSDSSSSTHSPDPPRLIVAMDYASEATALAFAERLDPQLCRLKVGFELFTRCGPSIITAFHQRGFSVFLDLKFHDIPNTVAAACRTAADLGVWMMNVHGLGGSRMLEAARQAIKKYDKRPHLIAVTVLTSHTADELAAVGIPTSPLSQALRLARLAQEAGLDGVVCSAQEAAAIRHQMGSRLWIVTPGIRLSAATATTITDDQRRIVTVQEAIQQGVDYLVVGRPITQAADPYAVLQAIQRQLGD